jgi:hypothetical protein
MNFCKCLSQSDRWISLSLISPVLVDNRHDVEECSYKESSDVDTINRFFFLQHSRKERDLLHLLAYLIMQPGKDNLDLLTPELLDKVCDFVEGLHIDNLRVPETDDQQHRISLGAVGVDDFGEFFEMLVEVHVAD